MEEFINVVLYDLKPSSNLDLAIETVKVIYTAYLSAEKAQRIEIN
ncbi:MAG: hypothetical protein N2513_02865 [Deltaproteobacteria bacterium]|nr:hypothetical protein [Deltaproteobacteria bacterium]